MGLAATQARFLATTSRKANCEFRSMELAQQKLSLSRELESATQDYEYAQQATRLIWDASTQDGDFRYALTADIMMSPSELNGYIPSLLSRQDGKIALNKNYVNAVSSVLTDDGGIIYNGSVVYKGDANYDTAKASAFTDFIENLKNNRAISSASAKKMLQDDGNGNKFYTYYVDAGVGGELKGKEVGNVMSINSMLNYVDYIVNNAASGYFETGSKEWELAKDLVFDFDRHDRIQSVWEAELYDKERGDLRVDSNDGSLSCSLSESWNQKDGTTCLLYNGSYCNDATFDNEGVAKYSSHAVTLSDLLNEDVSLLVTGQQNYTMVLQVITDALTNGKNLNANSLITKNVDEWYNEFINDKNDVDDYYKLVEHAKDGSDPAAASTLAILNYVDKLVKSMYRLLMPDSKVYQNSIKGNPTAENMNAFYNALLNTVERLRNNEGYAEEKNYRDISMFFSQNTLTQAENAIAAAENYNCWVKSGNEWAISLSNLTEGFLTDFVNAMDSFQDNCLIVQSANASRYITDNPYIMYDVNVVNEEDSGLWESEFYSVIFNNLCANGYYENQQIDDKSYLDNALKNGQLFVLSKDKDNYYYQMRYVQSADGHIMEEADSASIAVAEREYVYKKNKINFKEQQIDIENKRIDAELSALTTEFETVKSMIAKNVDKTFKLFQS